MTDPRYFTEASLQETDAITLTNQDRAEEVKREALQEVRQALERRYAEVYSSNDAWPQVGTMGDDRKTDLHIRTIRNTWEIAPLQILLRDLGAEHPRRERLITTVEQQIVRCELNEFMGGSIATQANIVADGKSLLTTSPRDVKLIQVEDDPLESGSGYSRRQIALWNASLKDAEVATIEDIKFWARQVNSEYIVSRREITIEIVGTSGPCESCQERLSKLAVWLLDHWSAQTGVPVGDLPKLEVWSYYGNRSKEFKRAGYFVRNGWAADGAAQRLVFTSKKGIPTEVKEHRVVSKVGSARHGTPNSDPSRYEVNYET